MKRKFCTLEELFKSGRFKVDDYVEYLPTPSVYIAKAEETGYRYAQSIETDKSAKFILYNYNDETKTFDIVTADAVNNLTLEGAIGFFYGPDVLNIACKESYSIPEMGILARSINMDDINKKTGFIPPDNPARFAYYPKGIGVSGEIEYNGNIYKKVSHINRNARFYICDGGGREKVDGDGNKYRVPQADNPVYVTSTFYSYSNKEKVSRRYWLASQCTAVYPEFAVFDIPIASSRIVRDINLYLYGSHGSAKGIGGAVRPLVSLSPKLLVDITDESRDGSLPKKAWKLVFDEGNDVSYFKNSSTEVVEKSSSDSTSVTKVDEDEEEKYKIIQVNDINLRNACDKLAKEVCLQISQGFKAVGQFRMICKDDEFILLQQVVKE